MAEKNYKKHRNVFLAILITALIVVGAMYSYQTSKAVQINLNVIKFNCKESGGAWSNEKCECPTALGEQLKYDTEKGYCMSSFGIPGGALGETAKKLQELEMLKQQ